MSALAQMKQSHDRLPRAAKWGLWFVVALAGYYAVDAALLAPWQRVRAEAEAERTRLEGFASQAEQFESAESSISMGIQRMGDVRGLPPQNEGVAALSRHIDEVLRERGLSGWTIRQTQGERSVPGTPAGVVDSDQVLVKVRLELNVEGKPDDIYGAIADLERSPLVSLIRQVRTRREDGSATLSATIIPEVWTVVDVEGGA